MGSNLYHAKQFVEAMPGTGGIISTIAKRVGCDWQTARKYIRTMPTVQKAYDAECEAIIDMAESVVIKKIQSGDSADAKWYLTKKGKQRGYVDRQEITGKDGKDIITVSWDDPDDSQG